MKDKQLSTEPYKGVRDFYPEDEAVQQYIFNVWQKTAESFGYKRYHSSVLEPADLYEAKGAENAEMVNEQTYTFTDRGDRRVTLRPEMTPSVARMVAKKQRELGFPIRWYSIPNLFRYERPQKGRLREHWQFNCDLFGSDHLASDVEVIQLAYQTMLNLGAKPEDFIIIINDRALMQRMYQSIGLSDEQIVSVTQINDRKAKISADEYREKLNQITGDSTLTEEIVLLVENTDEQSDVMVALSELGINNIQFDRSLARGFNYYTGTIFEIFATDENGQATGRSIIGGGRYDNLTAMFGQDQVTGVGFGMGDVVARDFLIEKQLLPTNLIIQPRIKVLPLADTDNFASLKVSNFFRNSKLNISTDISSKKLAKKINLALEEGVRYIIVVGPDEVKAETYKLKDLVNNEETSGQLNELLSYINSHNNLD